MWHDLSGGAPILKVYAAIRVDDTLFSLCQIF